MAPSDEAVVHKPENKRRIWRSLLADNQYDQLKSCVETAYKQAVTAGEAEQAALLAVASQLCASCVQIQKEVDFHQEAYKDSKLRWEKLAAELDKLLAMVQLSPETAVTAPVPTFWQRLQRLWRPDASVEEKSLPNEEVAPHIEETNRAPVEDFETVGISQAVPEEMPALPQHATINGRTPSLTVYCLGAFRVYEDEYPVEEWPSRKGKTIFKYLLLHRQQRTTKDVLMAQFWPEAAADAARNNLNVAIYGLRQALRNDHLEFSHVLFQDDCYFLNPEMEIWVDVEQFELIYGRARRTIQQGDTAVAISDLHAAELLYKGELLSEDPYEDWLIGPRQQLQRSYLKVLTRLCEYYFANKQYATCITFANKLLHIEPCHEATHRLLMRAFVQQRQWHLALRQYHQCVELLAEELTVSPDPTTTQLYEAIRKHQLV